MISRIPRRSAPEPRFGAQSMPLISHDIAEFQRHLRPTNLEKKCAARA
jgi:hypothetical protein